MDGQGQSNGSGLRAVLWRLTVCSVGFALGMIGCSKPDAVVREYASISTNRADGGWRMVFFESGKCEVYGPLNSRGTYSTNNQGYTLNTRLETPPLSKVMLKLRGSHLDEMKSDLVSIRTNGIEYLLVKALYQRRDDPRVWQDNALARVR